MNRSNANNLAFIGTSYLLAASALDEKLIVVDAIAKQGLLPVEIGLFPPATYHYFDTLSEMLTQSGCYVLILTEHHTRMAEGVKELIEQELEMVKRCEIPVIVFIHERVKPWMAAGFDSEPGGLFSIGQTLRACHLVEEVSWKTARQLEERTVAALRNFKSQRPTQPAAVPSAFLPQGKQNLNDDALYRKSIKLQGFYYSAIYMTVKEYWVEIGLEEISVNGEMVFPAREWGFHDSLQKKRFSEKEVYVGTASTKAGFLHIRLDKHVPPQDSLELRLYLGVTTDIPALAQEDYDILFGSVHGLTSRVPNQNFAYKTITARTGDDGRSIGPRHKNQIARHLNISRKSFVTKLEKTRFHEMPDMQLDRIKISAPEHIEGTYRIWTEGRKGKNEIAQSRMVVKGNYSATICNPVFENGKEQLCEIFFSSWLDEIRLIFVMRRQQDGQGPSDIASMAIMELPGKDQIGEILIGSFCSAGQKKDDRPSHHKTGVRGGYFVSKREELGGKVKAAFIKEKDIDPNSIDMLHLLRAANGRRNKKPKNKK